MTDLNPGPNTATVSTPPTETDGGERRPRSERANNITIEALVEGGLAGFALRQRGRCPSAEIDSLQ